MSNADRLAALAVTRKQKEFQRDFLAAWDGCVTWEDAPIRQPAVPPGEFVVEERMLAYNRGLARPIPFVDPEYARAHAPAAAARPRRFVTAIAFWMARPGNALSWICTPGARNPFQEIRVRERIRVGDRLTAVHENSDRFIRRGKPYITARITLRDQHGTEKVEFRGTLILPPTRQDVRRFATA
jgi:hypothetical protein